LKIHLLQKYPRLQKLRQGLLQSDFELQKGMGSDDWGGKLDILKIAIELDFNSAPHEFTKKRQRALELLAGVAKDQNLSPEQSRLLVQLRSSINDYYSPLFSRSWSMNFVLRDIQALKSTALRTD